MKNYVFTVIWLLSYFYSVYGEKFRSGYRQIIGNPDNSTKIERPCPTYDLDCIRVFFEKHAQCRKTYGPVPDPISRPQTNRFLPSINLTISTTDVKITGLNGRVEEFFINRETDNLVIAVEFVDLTQSTDNVFFQFSRRAKEPVVTRGSGSLSYSSFTITAVIPNIDDLQLNDAECTTYDNDFVPVLTLSPDAFESSDPQTAETFARFVADMPTNTQEFFLNDSVYYIASYIQYNICDFGLFIT